MRSGLKITELFFDRKKVIDAVGRATRAVLSRFGAFVRQTAKRSIRTRKAVSEPGKPPSSHTGILKRLIFFGYEPIRKSVVIGPVPFKRGEAPRLLEYGGSTRYRCPRGRVKIHRYRARPFMGPAFRKERPKLPDMWRNSVR